MNILLTLIFIIFVFLIGLIPFRVLYIFSDLMYLFLSGAIGYRKKIIYQNLKQSFPGLGKNELQKLVKLTYKNLTDVIVEGIKGFTMSRRQIKERHKVMNPELIMPLIESGRSIIGVPTHYGNWEWGSLSPGLFFDQKIVGFYKPLSNKYIDRYLQKNRGRTGTTLASIYKTAKTFELYKGKCTLYIMAADQSPSNAKRAYWVDFLGRDTAFLHGPEVYARKHNLPVVYVDVQRVKRGYYELYLTILAENPSELEEGEITKRYAKKLESVIRKQPENWLWSHKRWKLSK